MITDERVIRSDHGNPLRLVERDNGGLLVLQGRSHLVLSRSELTELAAAISDHLARPRIQRYVAQT